MSSTLNHSIETAQSTIDAANKVAGRAAAKAKHTVDGVRSGTEHALSSARATFWDRVKTVTEIVAMLRGFQTEDALGWVGLARRRSALLPLGIFAAGVAVGAGAGVLFAPMSGAELRRGIADRIAGSRPQAGTDRVADSTPQSSTDAATSGDQANSRTARDLDEQAKGVAGTADRASPSAAPQNGHDAAHRLA